MLSNSMYRTYDGFLFSGSEAILWIRKEQVEPADASDTANARNVVRKQFNSARDKLGR